MRIFLQTRETPPPVLRNSKSSGGCLERKGTHKNCHQHSLDYTKKTMNQRKHENFSPHALNTPPVLRNSKSSGGGCLERKGRYLQKLSAQEKNIRRSQYQLSIVGLAEKLLNKKKHSIKLLSPIGDRPPNPTSKMFTPSYNKRFTFYIL